MHYVPSGNRYKTMKYNRCGESGLKLPAVSLGLWQNFGHYDTPANGRAILRKAFDLGITHFDLANNYGPPPGAAEEFMGKMLKTDFACHRDELIISTKAGYKMWDGPYGDWGSKKYLMASLDQSLQRMGLDYVDIFYSHRPDPQTPLEETMGALEQAVKQGKALYAGISSYDAKQTKKAAKILEKGRVPCTIHQPRYSMFDRWVEEDLLDVLEKKGIGCIAFCPLSQGLLTDKYLSGIPENSRAGKTDGSLEPEEITDNLVTKIKNLNDIAEQRGQTLAQMAIAWLLKDNRLTSALIGASRIEHIEQNAEALKNTEFTADELETIEEVLGK